MLSKNQIKEIQSLQLKKFRKLKQLFIVEGFKAVTELVQTAPSYIEHLYAVQGSIDQYRQVLKERKVDYTEISEEELKKISLQSTPGGVLAICRYFEDTDTTYDFSSEFSFYLDDIRDPGNFGTIIRLADWFGVSKIFCSHESCDLYNPKVIQSTMGAFLRMKVCYATLEEVIKKNNVSTVYGAVLNGKNLYKEKLYNGLIVIGNEANGINKENLSHINFPLTIPAHAQSGTESLNAAMAASIIASEFFRQLKN
jgi:RNA methyltransferase, TrmH family